MHIHAHEHGQGDEPADNAHGKEITRHWAKPTLERNGSHRFFFDVSEGACPENEAGQPGHTDDQGQGSIIQQHLPPGGGSGATTNVMPP